VQNGISMVVANVPFVFDEFGVKGGTLVPRDSGTSGMGSFRTLWLSSPPDAISGD
jgi:hypothetical protein